MMWGAVITLTVAGLITALAPDPPGLPRPVSVGVCIWYLACAYAVWERIP